MAWENGVWLGRMTEEQMKAGGIWVIGDKPYDSSPDYPGKNNGEVLVKSWVANPDKYGGEGYEPKDRVREDRWEYVRVKTGRLECRIHGHELLAYPLSYPDEGVELPPDIKRSWHLPQHYGLATGITVCRKLDRAPFKAGAGHGYEYWPWEAAPTLQESHICNPANLRDWSVQYIEVFCGELLLLTAGPAPGQHDRHYLASGQHVFLRRGVLVAAFARLHHAHGVMIYPP